MNDDRIKLVHAAVVAMITSPEFVDGLVRKILAVVPAQQADNSAMKEICHCEHRDGWLAMKHSWALTTVFYCPSCGKLLQ